MSTQSDPGRETVRAQLCRMLESPPFIRASRMSRFLSLSVAETLDGHGARLKEYTLGVTVFDRGVSFDPAADPIVRVEARRLRAKIRDYYRRYGREDAVVIEIPKGAYAARIRWRAERSGARATAPAALWTGTIQQVPAFSWPPIRESLARDTGRVAVMREP